MTDDQADAARYRKLRDHLYLDGDRAGPDGPLVTQYVTMGFLWIPLEFTGTDVDAAIDAAESEPHA